MQLATALNLYAGGPGSGRHPYGRHTVDRSALAKQHYNGVTPEKVRAAGESVQQLAAALGAVATSNSQPWDILMNGTKIGIEVKRFMPGRKNLRTFVHSGENVKGASKSSGSKERKIEFADKSGMKRMFLVAHNTSGNGKQGWYVRRAGDRGDPRSDPKDPRTGWSYHIRHMQYGGLSPEGLKRYIK